MMRMNVWMILVLFSSPTSSFAGEKKEPAPRSLAQDAAFLVEKSGKAGWASEEVTVTMKEGATKAKGKLVLRISAAAVKDAPKEKSFVGISLGVDHGNSAVASSGGMFELMEKDGKRYIKTVPDPRAVGPEITLEYSIKGDELIVKGGVVRNWAGWDADLTKAIPFRHGK